MTSTLNDRCLHCSDDINEAGHCQSCVVHDLAMCAPLHDQELAELEILKLRQTYPSGAIIFQEGRCRKKVYTVVSGAVRLVKTLNDGRRCITGFAFPGDFLGFTDTGTHILTAETLTPVVVCAFDRESVDLFFRKHISVRDRFLAMAKAELQRSYENQLILSRLAPVEKIARFLYDLMQRMENSRLKSSPLKLAMNRTDIADHLGLTIETVSRCFSKLKVQGVIKLVSVNQVEIVNRAALKRIAVVGDEVE